MEHQDKAQENPPIEVELTRKEMGDLFGVSGETIKRRTAEGHLKPMAKNSRVLHYGEKDIQSMVKMGYRLGRTAAQVYKIPVGALSTEANPALATLEKIDTATSQDKEKVLLKFLRHHSQDPAAKSIMLRFFATLILQDDLN